MFAQLIRAILAAALIVAAGATPASATTPAVYVENHAPSVWPVTAGASFVDRYTGSHFVYVRTCPAGRTCVRIIERTINRQWGAVTFPGSPVTTIYLNPTRRGYSYARRLYIVTHELGHAMGIYTHTPTCTDVMWGRTSCPNGTIPPLRFSAGERAILARH